jgi:hypothetical protein
MIRISGSRIYLLKSEVFFIPPSQGGRRLSVTGKKRKSTLVPGPPLGKKTRGKVSGSEAPASLLIFLKEECPETKIIAIILASFIL